MGFLSRFILVALLFVALVVAFFTYDLLIVLAPKLFGPFKVAWSWAANQIGFWIQTSARPVLMSLAQRRAFAWILSAFTGSGLISLLGAARAARVRRRRDILVKTTKSRWRRARAMWRILPMWGKLAVLVAITLVFAAMGWGVYLLPLPLSFLVSWGIKRIQVMGVESTVGKALARYTNAPAWLRKKFREHPFLKQLDSPRRGLRLAWIRSLRRRRDSNKQLYDRWRERLARLPAKARLPNVLAFRRAAKPAKPAPGAFDDSREAS